MQRLKRESCRVLFGIGLLVFLASSLWAEWIEDGVPLCIAPGQQENPIIVSDGAGGAIVTWQSGYWDWDIHARRVAADGTPLWDSCGVALCTAPEVQSLPAIVSDGAGGAIVAWQDNRSGDYDICAQRVDVDGDTLWTADGVALCTPSGDQTVPVIASDGAGGAIVTWRDNRSGNEDIYVARLEKETWYILSDGSGDAPTIQAGVDSVPAGGCVLLAPGTYTGPGNRDIDFLDKGVTVTSVAGCASTIIDCEGDVLDPHRGFYFHSEADSASVLEGVTIKNCFAPPDSAPPLNQGGGILYAGASPAIKNVIISRCSAVWGGAISCWDSSPTLENVTISGNKASGDPQSAAGGLACFDGSNVTASNCILWGDTAATAQSEVYVDATSSITLTCCDVDLPGVGGPGDITLNDPISIDPLFCGIVYCDTSAWDPDTCSCNPDAGQFDLHADSPCAAENNPVCGQIGARPVGCHPTTDAPKGPDGRSAETLLWNAPNPFKRFTRITYVVPSDVGRAQVLLRIYDPVGRLVRTLVDGHKPHGTYDAVWDGRDKAGRLVPSGVYFCQVKAGDLVETKRMVLVR